MLPEKITRNHFTPLLILFILGAFIIPSKGFSQKLIKGTVTSDSVHGIERVEVKVKGTVSHTITDADGNYFISAGDNETLVFSKEGYTTQEVFVNGREIINILLQKAANALVADSSSILELTGYLPSPGWLVRNHPPGKLLN